MRIGICGGGPREQLPLTLEADYWIGADSGAIRLLEKGITPDFIIGDLDSIQNAEREKWQTQLMQAVQVSPEKDETDTYLALERAVEMLPKQIVLVGVTGGRLDHYQAVLHDMLRFQLQFPSIQFELLDRDNRILFLQPGVTEVEKNEYTYCSFFSWQGDVLNVSLTGFKYPVQNDLISKTSARFTSNEIVEQVGSISFSSGICLCIQSREESGD